MKVNGENFLLNLDKYSFNNISVLISGNEPGLILNIERKILKKLKNSDSQELGLFDMKNDKDFDLKQLVFSQSLFGSQNIILIKNPKESIIKELENLDIENNTVVLNGEGLKGGSKIKKFFDAHKSFLSIVCYKISSSFKKKIIDLFINENDLRFDKEAYWFLIENSSNEYQMLENELIKISTYSKKEISLLEIRKLLSTLDKP